MDARDHPEVLMLAQEVLVDRDIFPKPSLCVFAMNGADDKVYPIRIHLFSDYTEHLLCLALGNANFHYITCFHQGSWLGVGQGWFRLMC